METQHAVEEILDSAHALMDQGVQELVVVHMPEGAVALERDPLRAAATLLRSGGIVGVKGLGGFHLACDARSSAAISKLRERKRRDEKPFAIMTEWGVADIMSQSDGFQQIFLD